MGEDASGGRAERFSAYMNAISEVLGDPRRHGPMTSYCTGLLMPADRKSVEPMAAMTAPERTAAQHQSLLHFVGKGEWSDADVLAKVREQVVPAITTHGAISAWIVDDTGFPKKGRHSVGVARQYCGQLGKQDNCQVAVSLSIANDHASLPVAYGLYLPQSWADDRERRDQEVSLDGPAEGSPIHQRNRLSPGRKPLSRNQKCEKFWTLPMRNTTA